MTTVERESTLRYVRYDDTLVSRVLVWHLALPPYDTTICRRIITPTATVREILFEGRVLCKKCQEPHHATSQEPTRK